MKMLMGKLTGITRRGSKLLFVGMPPRAMRARCGDIRYYPAPLGIVTFCKSFLDALARERPKASPVQGEVSFAKVNDGGVVKRHYGSGFSSSVDDITSNVRIICAKRTP